MVAVLYVIAAGLALWGAVVILSGDLVAMLDIATNLFGCAAIVAGLGAVAGGLNRIARTINRITVEAAETGEPAATMPMMAPAVERVSDDEIADHAATGTAADRERRREAKARRKARLPAADPTLSHPDFSDPDYADAPFPGEPHPVPPLPPVTEERLDSGARAWVQRRDSPEAYAPRRRVPEAVFAAPAVLPDPPELAETEEPRGAVVRSGTLNGVLYRFYADGSVEAVTPTGLRHFRSMEELRHVILAARSGGTAPAEELDVDVTPHEEPVAAQPDVAADTGEHPAAAARSDEPDLPELADPAESPPPEEQLTPEKRLELFRKNIWASTLAELRRPVDAPRRARSDAGPAAPLDASPDDEADAPERRR